MCNICRKIQIKRSAWVSGNYGIKTDTPRKWVYNTRFMLAVGDLSFLQLRANLQMYVGFQMLFTTFYFNYDVITHHAQLVAEFHLINKPKFLKVYLPNFVINFNRNWWRYVWVYLEWNTIVMGWHYFTFKMWSTMKPLGRLSPVLVS